MTRDEVTAILAVLKTAYPSFYRAMSDEELDDVINLWATMFESDNAKVVTEAVKALICTLKYPPTIADVKEKIREITQPQAMTEMEAWNLVLGAIDYYNAAEKFDKLPPTIRQVVGSPNQLREWAVMDTDTVNSVVQSNFMRSYKAKAALEREYAMLPESTKMMIHSISAKMNLKGLPGGNTNA